MDYSIMDQLNALFKIIRPPDGVVMGVGLVVGVAMAGGVEQDVPFLAYVLVFIGGFLVTSHAMIINDIIDIDIDRINEPNRVLPSGIISPEIAFVFSIILALTGILLFALLDVFSFVSYPLAWFFVLLHVLLADLYNLKLKKLGFIGNIVVAYTLYSLFLFSDLFINGHLTLLPQLVGIMGFTANLSREIFKGIIDVEGDREHNVSTIAVKLGKDRAKYIAFVLLLTSILVGVSTIFLVGLIGKVGMALVSFELIYTLYLSRNAEDRQISRRVKTYILIGPFLAAPFLVIDLLIPL
jgi:geranylgeranylglycerol-phosphate geranylgeranyltransferase